MTTDDVSFIDYLNAVDDLLETRCGITSADTDTAGIAAAQDDLWTPEACMAWLAEKYDLTEIKGGHLRRGAT